MLEKLVSPWSERRREPRGTNQRCFDATQGPSIHGDDVWISTLTDLPKIILVANRTSARVACAPYTKLMRERGE